MILHITNDYSGSTVYRNLIRELDVCGIEQIVYTPIRDPNKIGLNKIEFSKSTSKIIYSPILNKYSDRIFYRNKVNKILNDIEEKVDLKKISIIHAHTWFSDGGVALKLHQKYNIPYIVAVRNSDINIFFRYLVHQRHFAEEILVKADKVIVISASYLERMKQMYATKPVVTSKLSIIPNGVDPFWIINRVSKPKFLNKESSNLLYIGKFDKGKNVVNLMKAILNINKTRKGEIILTLVGGGGTDQKRVNRLIETNKCFRYLGKIMELEKLKSIFKENNFFVMPSKAETFGLVYIEALLQGLPILFTKGEGIDGYYDHSIGEKVNDGTIQEIQNKLNNLLSNENIYNFDLDRISQNHDWKGIALTYSDIYNAFKR